MSSTDETLVETPTSPGGRAAPLSRGDVVGRYVVLAKLGAGGMGVVFSAYDPELDRKVALKLLHAQPSGESRATEGHRRLLREAQAMAKLSHPNVITVHDVGEHAGRVFLAMEFVDGKTLGAWLSAESRSWEEILDVFIAAGTGLAAAHDKGLVHRDFKPENVMIGNDDRVRVMDFGLARSGQPDENEHRRVTDLNDLELSPGSDALATALTRHGALIGTPAYMAPEQWRGDPTDARTDEFSYCVALWEALYGKRPFAGDSLNALAFNVSEGNLGAVPSGRAPSWVRRVLTRGLATSPEQRHPTMSELLGQLHSGRRRAHSTRALAVLAVTGVCVAGFFGYQHHEEQQREQACLDAGASIEDTWNAQVRTRVREGLLASGASYAPTTVDHVMPWLDRQADEWRAQATDQCLDATVRGRLDADTYDRGLWCMEERRFELAALAAEFERADVPVMQRAVVAAAGLPPVSGCGDPLLLVSRPPPPSASDRAAVGRAGLALRRARLLGRAGRIDEGKELLRQAREEVEELAWPPLSASARFVECYLLDRGDAHAEAEEACVDAYMQGARARAWDVAADAANRLVYNVGYEQARAAEARVWAQHAEIAAAFAGDPMRTWEAERVHYLAYVGGRAGDARAGREGLERALAIWETTLGEEHPHVAVALNGLGNSFYSTGDYRAAIEQYERALRISIATLGPDHPHSTTALTNLGMLHETLGEHAQAKAMHERALALKERAVGPDHIDVAYSLVNLALVHESMEDFEGAAALGRRATTILERALGPDHPDLAQALNNLGTVVARQGLDDEARALHERALTIREQSYGSDHPDVAMSLVHLGELDRRAGRHDRALAGYERAVGIFDAAEGLQPDELSARFGLADALLRTGGDRSRALAEAEKAADGFRELGEGKGKELEEVEQWLAAHALRAEAEGSGSPAGRRRHSPP